MAVDYEQDLILVTCASGRQASHIFPHLSQKFKRLRLACNSSTSADRLRKQYSEIGYNMIDAAVAASQTPSSTFQHFICSSILQSMFHKMLNHDSKRYVKEYLVETDLNWTIVQPSHFMDVTRPTITGLATSTETELVFTAGFNPNTCFSCLALQDLDEAVAKIVDQREKHFFALYPFVSMETPMSYSEMFKVVEKVLRKPVTVQQQPFEEAVSGLLRVLTGGEVRDVHPKTAVTAERMLLFYNRRGLVGNPNVLEMVLGRMATTYEDWVKSVVQTARREP